MCFETIEGQRALESFYRIADELTEIKKNLILSNELKKTEIGLKILELGQNNGEKGHTITNLDEIAKKIEKDYEDCINALNIQDMIKKDD